NSETKSRTFESSRAHWKRSLPSAPLNGRPPSKGECKCAQLRSQSSDPRVLSQSQNALPLGFAVRMSLSLVQGTRVFACFRLGPRTTFCRGQTSLDANRRLVLWDG